MPDIRIEIKNIGQIKSAFAAAPTLMKNNLNQAIKTATFMVGRDSRILTPVDTGRLRASTSERFQDLKGIVQTRTNYDVFVHEGTRFMRARPYMRNAVERNTPAINLLFAKAAQDTLNDIGRRT